MHKALIQLCVNCEEFVCKEHSLQNIVKTINDTNSILLVKRYTLFASRVAYFDLNMADRIAYYVLASVRRNIFVSTRERRRIYSKPGDDGEFQHRNAFVDGGFWSRWAERFASVAGKQNREIGCPDLFNSTKMIQIA